MSERREITGTVYRVPGARKNHLSVLEQLILQQVSREDQERAGLKFYPDLIVIWADFNATFHRGDGLHVTDHKHQYRWKTHRYPEAVKDAQTGQRVTMTATLEPFRNGLGHYITRPANIVVEAS